MAKTSCISASAMSLVRLSYDKAWELLEQKIDENIGNLPCHNTENCPHKRKTQSDECECDGGSIEKYGKLQVFLIFLWRIYPDLCAWWVLDHGMYGDETDTQDWLVGYSIVESEFLVVFLLSFSFGNSHSFAILYPYLFSYEWSNLR